MLKMLTKNLFSPGQLTPAQRELELLKKKYTYGYEVFLMRCVFFFVYGVALASFSGLVFGSWSASYLVFSEGLFAAPVVINTMPPVVGISTLMGWATIITLPVLGSLYAVFSLGYYLKAKDRISVKKS